MAAGGGIFMAKKESGWDKWREKQTRAAKKKAKKTAKKIHKGYFIIAVLFLAIGITAGYFCAQYVTKDDRFELSGVKETAYAVGDTVKYTDEGIKYVSFGKELSGSVEIETNMTKTGEGYYTADTSEAAEYYIIYKAVGGRCDGLTLYRVFKITEGGAEQ